MSHITNYRRLFSPSSNLYRKAGNTEPANYIAYDVYWHPEKGPEAVVPYYFEIPRSSEGMVRDMIAQAYDDMDHQLLSIDEKVTTVFRPVIDVDGIPWGTPRETVLEFVRSLISYAYKNIFAYPKRERRWSRRVMVLTSNPFHRQRHFPYHGNTEDCEAYFTKVKKDGFGLHIAFCEEKVLREQYRALAFNLKTLCPGDFSAKIDLFDTQLTKDGLMKLRMPLCDNGRKGFPLKPYVPMGYYQINVDTDENSFAVETLEDSLYAEMVMDNCHMRLESMDVATARNPRRPNSLCFIENSKYITSVFTDNFYAWFAANFNREFVSSMSRLARCCLPITGTRLGYISMESCASDMHMVVDSIIQKITTSNNAIANRIANEQSLGQYDTSSLIKECIDALNEVVFWVSSRQCYHYIVKNSNLDRKELMSFNKGHSPDFGITMDVYELCEPITKVRGNNVSTEAPRGYEYQAWSVKCWKKTPFIKLWKSKHTVVSDVIFDPSVAVGPGEKVQKAKEENRVVINTFPGFKVSVDVLQETWRVIQDDPRRMRDLENFRNFIRYCVIGGNIPTDCVDEESLSYRDALERYYKQLLVLPHERTNVVLSIKGEAGYGKSLLLGWWIKYVYGEFSALCVTVSDPTLLFGNFSFPDMDKMLYIYVDEATLNKDPKERAKVKQMVTGKSSGFNPKYKDPFVSEVYFNLVTSANQVDNVKIDSGDRRMLCFTTWNSNRSDPRVALYFNDPRTGRERPTVDAYAAYVERKGIFKDWLCYLACREHYPEVYEPGFNFQASIPKTHTYQQAISMSFDAYNYYWYTALMKRSCTSPRNTQTAVSPLGGLTITRQKKMVKSEKAWEEIVQNYIDSDVKFSEMWNKMTAAQKVLYRNDPHAFKSEKIKEMLLHQEYMTLEESRHYYDHCLSDMEKECYRDFLKATGTNDSPSEDDTFQYFTGVYNEHNREWPRWLPLGVVKEEISLSVGGKSAFRYNQQVLVESIAKNVGANEAEFAANAVSSTLLEIPDWLTCQKKFALRNRYSFNYIKTLCARAGNNINGRRSDLVIAPWPDTYYRENTVPSFEGEPEEDEEAIETPHGGGGEDIRHGQVRKVPTRDAEEEEITSSLEELFFSPDFGYGDKGKEPFDEEEEDRPPLTKLRRFADEEEL